jgi:hypothetical protein
MAYQVECAGNLGGRLLINSRGPWLRAALVIATITAVLVEQIHGGWGFLCIIAVIVGASRLLPGSGDSAREIDVGAPHDFGLPALLALVVLALTLRIVQLTELPPRFDSDEARQAKYALYLADCALYDSNCSVRPLANGWNELPNLSYLPTTSFLQFARFLNLDFFWSARAVSAILGSISVGLIFLLLRPHLGLKAAFFASLLLACNRQSLEWSKIATSNIQAQLVLLLFLIAFDRAARRDTQRSWYLFGVVSALGAFSYHSSKVLFVLGPILITWFIVRTSSQKSKNRILPFAMAWLILGVPTLVDQIRRSFAGVLLNDRTLQDDIIGMIASRHFIEVWNLLSSQLYRSVMGLFLENGTLPFGFHGPLLDPILCMLVLIGLVRITRLPAQIRISVLLSALLIFILGGVMTINPLHHPRLLGLTTSLIVIAGCACTTNPHFRLRSVLVIVLFLAASFYNLVNHFSDLPRQQVRDESTSEARKFGAMLRSLRNQHGISGVIRHLGETGSEQYAFALRFYRIESISLSALKDLEAANRLPKVVVVSHESGFGEISERVKSLNCRIHAGRMGYCENSEG